MKRVAKEVSLPDNHKGLRRVLMAMALFSAIAMSTRPALAEDYLSSAAKLLNEGQIKGAQIQLRNAVRTNPENALARYNLARVDLQLGDATAAETEARIAGAKGYDPVTSMNVITQSYLEASRFRDLLRDFPALKARREPPAVAAVILAARGLALAALGQRQDAVQSIAEARAMAPGSIYPLLGEEHIALRYGDLAGARRAVKAAIALAPNEIEVLDQSGEVSLLLNRHSEAMATFQQALSISPSDATASIGKASILIAEHKLDQAKGIVDKVLAQTPNDGRALYLQTVTLILKHDWKAADANLNRLAGVMGSFPNGFLLWAIVKDNLNQPEQAAEAARKFAAHNPSDQGAPVLVAEFDLKARHARQASSTLQAAVDSGRATAETYDLLGRIQAAAGQASNATRSFQRAISLDPNNPDIITHLGATLARNRPNEAITEYEKALALSPQRTDTQEMLIVAALSAGRIERAEQALQQYRAIKTADPVVVANLSGLLAMARFDLPSAEADFHAALKLQPRSVPTMLNLAHLESQAGHDAQSTALLDQILTIDPGNLQALAVRAGVAAAAGQTAKVDSLLADAAKAQAKHQPAILTIAALALDLHRPEIALRLINPFVLTPDQMAASNGRKDAQLQAGLLAFKARILFSEMKPGPAIEAAKAAVLAVPNQPKTILLLAKLQAAAKAFKAAIATVQSGLRDAPRSSPLMNTLLALEWDANPGHPEIALAMAREMSADAGHGPEAASLVGNILMRAHRFRDAADAYKAAMASTPSSSLALSYALALRAIGQVSQGDAAMDAWVRQHPEDINGLTVMSGWDMAAGRYDLARRRFLAVLAAQPNNATVLNNMAWVDQHQGHLNAAQHYATKAYLASPTPAIADTLAWIMLVNGTKDLPAALALLHEAMAAIPGNPEVRYHLAVALSRTGDKDEALKLLAPLVAKPVAFEGAPQARALYGQLDQH